MAPVVPLVGTWIETSIVLSTKQHSIVVPLVGTWIETKTHIYLKPPAKVVPLVGTWIETHARSHEIVRILSFPSWERGLKHLYLQYDASLHASFPSWERGLKLISLYARGNAVAVVPLVKTWIEPLKRMYLAPRRSPCGKVIEIA